MLSPLSPSPHSGSPFAGPGSGTGRLRPGSARSRPSPAAVRAREEAAQDVAEKQATSTYEDRRRAAGQALFSACEDLLGVDGPAAVARATRRSKAWWSKLRSGKGGSFPSWSELDQEVLSADTSAEIRSALQVRHRVAWLLLHDPDFLAETNARSQTLPEVPDEHFQATHKIARRALHDGQFVDARHTLRLLAGLLSAAGLEMLSRQRLLILGLCFRDLAACERNLGSPEDAVHAARHAAECFRRAGHSVEESDAHCELALALSITGRLPEGLQLLEQARARFQRLGCLPQAVSAARAAAMLSLSAGRPREAEATLMRLLLEAERLPPRDRYPTLLTLAECHMALRNQDAADHWLAEADDLAEEHPDQLGESSLSYELRRRREALRQALR